jgi:large exoprotein involved in heme utilization and adhesion
MPEEAAAVTVTAPAPGPVSTWLSQQGFDHAVLPADQAKAQALPTGGNVVGGSGTISQTSANQLTINQNSATLSIDWQSFSVGAGNIVRFIPVR